MKTKWEQKEERKGKKALDIIMANEEPKQLTAKEIIEMEDNKLVVKADEAKATIVTPKAPKAKIVLAANIIAMMTPDQVSAYNLLTAAREANDEKSAFKARRMLRKSGIYLSGQALGLAITTK